MIIRNFTPVTILVVLAAAALFAAPKISFEAEEVSLGKMIQGEKKTITYVVKNSGDAELDVTDVRPTCGCTSTGKSSFKLKPGEKTTIPFEFNSGNFLGEVHKSVTVRSNDPSRESVSLKFTANIEAIIEIEPHYVSFEAPVNGTLSAQKIFIKNKYDLPIKQIDASIEGVDVVVMPTMPMKKLAIKKDSTQTIELSTLFSTSMAESKYGQIKLTFEYLDGRKLEKTVSVAVRK
ncbi:MAG: DUF1573 domain-containing protein [Fibrobacteres bacterium]|nr:DUF1573 domain-containing protein [Fibrobacterota bacterium]